MPISPIKCSLYSWDGRGCMVHLQLHQLLLRMSLLHTRILHVYAFHNHDNQQRNVTL